MPACWSTDSMLCVAFGGRSGSWPWRSNRSERGLEGLMRRPWPCSKDKVCSSNPSRRPSPPVLVCCWSSPFCSPRPAATRRSVVLQQRYCWLASGTASRSASAKSPPTASMAWRGCSAPGWKTVSRSQANNRGRLRCTFSTRTDRGKTLLLHSWPSPVLGEAIHSSLCRPTITTPAVVDGELSP